MKTCVVYTAIFNNYDWLKDPIYPSNNVDYICFTDSDQLESKVWKIIPIELNGVSPSLLNRKIKLLYPYTYFHEYDYSLYVDGSIMIKGDLDKFLNKYISHSLIITNFKHPNNNCIYEEMIRCIQQHRGNPQKLMEQYRVYKNNHMPVQYGLSDNKILLRNHKSELGKKMMEEWFQHVEDYSGRDQVCLSYILHQNGLHYQFFTENIESNEFFETWPHNTDSWVVRSYRKFKWFCDKRHILQWLIRFLEVKVKPYVLKHI